MPHALGMARASLDSSFHLELSLLSFFLSCSKLHPEMGEVLLKDPPPGTGSSTLPAVLRLCGKVDLLDQVGGSTEVCCWGLTLGL